MVNKRTPIPKEQTTFGAQTEKEVITGGDCVDCGTPVVLIYWGDRDTPDEWECPKCEGKQ